MMPVKFRMSWQKSWQKKNMMYTTKIVYKNKLKQIRHLMNLRIRRQNLLGKLKRKNSRMGLHFMVLFLDGPRQTSRQSIFRNSERATRSGFFDFYLGFARSFGSDRRQFFIRSDKPGCGSASRLRH